VTPIRRVGGFGGRNGAGTFDGAHDGFGGGASPRSWNFKAIVVMACDQEVLPFQARIESAADEIELDDIYETERKFLYVACTPCTGSAVR
jgi:hypothetical protein